MRETSAIALSSTALIRSFAKPQNSTVTEALSITKTQSESPTGASLSIRVLAGTPPDEFVKRSMYAILNDLGLYMGLIYFPVNSTKDQLYYLDVSVRGDLVVCDSSKIYQR
jgi:hypothetical protein